MKKILFNRRFIGVEFVTDSELNQGMIVINDFLKSIQNMMPASGAIIYFLQDKLWVGREVSGKEETSLIEGIQSFELAKTNAIIEEIDISASSDFFIKAKKKATELGHSFFCIDLKDITPKNVKVCYFSEY